MVIKNDETVGYVQPEIKVINVNVEGSILTGSDDDFGGDAGEGGGTI